jgi:hypothetical protein
MGARAACRQLLNGISDKYIQRFRGKRKNTPAKGVTTQGSGLQRRKIPLIN